MNLAKFFLEDNFNQTNCIHITFQQIFLNFLCTNNIYCCQLATC